MKLNWKGNQRYNEDVSKATIFEIKDPIRISIHRMAGCGEEIYLSSPAFGVSQRNLHTESWEEAEELAINTIQEKAKQLYDSAMKLTE